MSKEIDIEMKVYSTLFYFYSGNYFVYSLFFNLFLSPLFVPFLFLPNSFITFTILLFPPLFLTPSVMMRPLNL